MAVTGINYKEGSKKKDLEYKSVRVHYGQNEEKIFDSGNFVKDWYDSTRFCILELSDKEFHFSNSSSVDHFIMDGAEFSSAYLKMHSNKATLVYEYDFNDPGIEFFVPVGTEPTCEELKMV